MALKDQIELGMSLPHRGPEPVDMTAVEQVARRSDALGFRDLWVTENTVDHVFSFDPFVALTWAAAVTKKIRVGVSVSILPVHDPIMMAHRVATLDYMSGGRALLGVGLGRDFHYETFGVAKETRVRRFREALELMKALWSGNKTTYKGSLLAIKDATMSPRPVQRPHPPIWFGGGHPAAVERAAELADAWMAAGGSTTADFGKAVPLLKAALAKAGRKVAGYPISKRVFLSVHDKPEVARAEVDRWYREVYHNPKGADTSGVHGTPDQVRAQLEALVAMGATHLLLNPVARYAEQVEALAKLTGLA